MYLPILIHMYIKIINICIYKNKYITFISNSIFIQVTIITLYKFILTKQRQVHHHQFLLAN